jgi:hypothetical protein
VFVVALRMLILVQLALVLLLILPVQDPPLARSHVRPASVGRRGIPFRVRRLPPARPREGVELGIVAADSTLELGFV